MILLGTSPPIKGTTFSGAAAVDIRYTSDAKLPAGNSDRTFSFWINPGLPTGNSVIFSYGVPGGAGVGLIEVATLSYGGGFIYGIHYYGNGGSELASINSKLYTGRAEFVTLEYESSTSNLYLFRNAILQGNGNTVVPNTVVGTNGLRIGTGIFIGSGVPATTSEVQIWSGLRTATQLQSDMYGITNPTAQANLKFYCKLDTAGYADLSANPLTFASSSNALTFGNVPASYPTAAKRVVTVGGRGIKIGN